MADDAPTGRGWQSDYSFCLSLVYDSARLFSSIEKVLGDVFMPLGRGKKPTYVALSDEHREILERFAKEKQVSLSRVLAWAAKYFIDHVIKKE